jgi:outer membrane protein OmpA-like peptidoglycan-associated protein
MLLRLSLASTIVRLPLSTNTTPKTILALISVRALYLAKANCLLLTLQVRGVEASTMRPRFAFFSGLLLLGAVGALQLADLRSPLLENQTNPPQALREDGTSKNDAPVPAKLSRTSPPPATETRPPAVRLLENFEAMVVTAREEAKRHDSASGSAKAEKTNSAPAKLAVAEPMVPATRQEVKGPPSSAQPQSISITPIPMTFVYNEATLTPEGRRAANLLLEYLNLKKFDVVTLSGHADERGLTNYNMELSKKRLLVILRLLRDGGYQGKLELLPKGSTEPYTGVDRSQYPYEELMQLDRRVELRVTKSASAR